MSRPRGGLNRFGREAILEPETLPMPIRPLTSQDLPEILSVQRACYRAELLEREATFRRKLEAFPAGCLGLEREGRLGGYLFCQPWAAARALPLDDPGEAPAGKPDCLYLHDLAVLPAWRGTGAATGLLAAASVLAATLGLRRFALVSVQDSEPFWARLGFRPVRRFDYAPGVPGVHMIRD
jgi:GNAT superfamily N-acetyltransferase